MVLGVKTLLVAVLTTQMIAMICFQVLEQEVIMCLMPIWTVLRVSLDIILDVLLIPDSFYTMEVHCKKTAMTMMHLSAESITSLAISMEMVSEILTMPILVVMPSLDL